MGTYDGGSSIFQERWVGHHALRPTFLRAVGSQTLGSVLGLREALGQGLASGLAPLTGGTQK